MRYKKDVLLLCFSLPLLLFVSCLYPLFSVSRTLSGSLFSSPLFPFSVCTSHSELRTYSNKVCCCTAVYHTKYVIYQVPYSSIIRRDRASQMVDCCSIPGHLKLTGCRCLYRFDCKLATPCLYDCQDAGCVTTVRNPSIPTCMCQQLFKHFALRFTYWSTTEFYVVGMVVHGRLFPGG